ncbi:histidine kinase N-terminal 7TM domain-containing protein [Halobaculum litoreum]|uniref:Histidine kinase N-terminal 7TM domain-containing protein n=1 Tax=Halobaculum litoreum TaxID=3031998 RepID=A0ABD5XMH9_9EURY
MGSGSCSRSRRRRRCSRSRTRSTTPCGCSSGGRRSSGSRRSGTRSSFPGYAALLVGLGTAAVGVLLLVGAIQTYGPLYRRESTAIALSTLFPATGVVVWLVGAGPWPAVNFGAPLLLFHVALDAYAFVGTRLFETAPTTQRAAKRSALDDLAEPLLVLDTEAAVVNMNRRAETLFDADGRDAVPVPFADLAGADLDDVRARGSSRSAAPTAGSSPSRTRRCPTSAATTPAGCSSSTR